MILHTFRLPSIRTIIAVFAVAAMTACSATSNSSKNGPSLGVIGQPDSTKADLANARSAFERFKSLVGDWRGTASGGKETSAAERLTYELIAGGSVVMETCHHSDAVMITMYHLDGDHLMLTHYCVAKNQPRMRAGDFADAGRSVTFTYFDGTGMSGRDQGHMDKARFKFIDADHFNSKWTWYENGKEQWMEEFAYTRIK